MMNLKDTKDEKQSDLQGVKLQTWLFSFKIYILNFQIKIVLNFFWQTV